MNRALALGPRRFGPVNWRGLYALTRREATRGMSDYNYQLFGPVVSAMLYLAVFHLAARTTVGMTTSDLISFIAPGLIIYTACEKAYEGACGSFIFDKHERIIADLLMAPLNALERMIGYVAGTTLNGLVVGFAVAMVSLFFIPLGLAQPWAILYFALTGIAMHSLVGILVGIWAEKWDQFAAIQTFILIPLSFLSGLFYQVGALPELAQVVVRWNPIFYVIDGFRFGLTGEAAADPLRGALVVAGVDLALGLWVYLWFRRGYKLKP